MNFKKKEKEKNPHQIIMLLEGRKIITFLVKILPLFLSALPDKNASLVDFRFNVRVIYDKQVRGLLFWGT